MRPVKAESVDADANGTEANYRRESKKRKLDFVRRDSSHSDSILNPVIMGDFTTGSGLLQNRTQHWICASSVLCPNVVLEIPSGISRHVAQQLLELDEKFEKYLSQFGDASNFPKIAQKRFFGGVGNYNICYSWRYSPHAYLDIAALSNFTLQNPNVISLKFNPTGGCCSLVSNELMGICTPCYCDECNYVRDVENSVFSENSPRFSQIRDLVQKKDISGPGDDSFKPNVKKPTLMQLPRCPEKNMGRLMMQVNVRPRD